jgi:phage repressor protein C with HTH and peptisase S24 domain
LIEGPENSKNDYFACKIVGESMNRVIPNGSICLFKPIQEAVETENSFS